MKQFFSKNVWWFALFFGLLGMGGLIFNEYATTSFGWTLLDIATAVGLVGFLACVVYVLSKTPKQ